MSGLCRSRATHHGTGVGADAHVVVGVAHVANHLADDVGIMDHRLGGDFARHHRHARGHQRLAGHAAVGVLGEQGVKNAVGNLVGKLVRVSHADRFAGEQELCLEPRVGSSLAVENWQYSRHYKTNLPKAHASGGARVRIVDSNCSNNSQVPSPWPPLALDQRLGPLPRAAA